MGSAILKSIMMVLVVSINNSCGFVPLHNHPNSMDIFKNIRIQSDTTFIAFLIKEALEEKAPFRESAQITLSLKPIIKNSYGVITKENEITRYSVTLDVEYSLSSIKKNKLLFNNKVSATSDYSAAVTYTGFATEIARKDTYERLANTVAEKIITEIFINLDREFSH